MKKAFFIYVLLSLFSGEYLYSQCAVSTECLQYNITTYHCLEQPAVGSFKLSDFISPNGPLPASGGFVNVIIDGNLLVDVDYTFDASAHVLMTPGSSIKVSDGIPGNLMGPKLVFKGNSTVSSCDGYWDFIRVVDPYASLLFDNAVVTQGEEGIWALDGTAISAISSTFTDFKSAAIRIGDEVGSNQDIKVYLVDNELSTMPTGISIYNTKLVSIGSDNEIKSPAYYTSSTPSKGIVVVNSSVSIGENNLIDRYTIGILGNNHSEQTQFLNLKGVEIKNVSGVGVGMNLQANNLGLQFVSEGFDLFVKSCKFTNLRQGILAEVDKGNTYKILDNEFSNTPSGISTGGIDIRGKIPHSIEIKRNYFYRQFTGILTLLPSWHAEENLQISQNDLDRVVEYGILFSPATGGIVSENEITVTGVGFYRDGIVAMSDGSKITYNDVTLEGAEYYSGTNAGILIGGSDCVITCNTTQGNGMGVGLAFHEHCDNTIIARNAMSNHQRGLQVGSVHGDGVIGKQTYRDNRWYGGIMAEAVMRSYTGAMINPFFFDYNQFTTRSNTAPLWPDPIIPTQSTSGNDPDAWFRHIATPELPTICPASGGDDEEAFHGLTDFEWGLINGDINELAGSEGKYRDIDFGIYKKLTDDPSLLDVNNLSYYNNLNTASFQKRYLLENKLEHLSGLSTSLAIEEQLESLMNHLDDLVFYDDGSHTVERDLALSNVESLLNAIEVVKLPYRTLVDNELNVIQAAIQSWIGEELADNTLKTVAAIYFSNWGKAYDDYPEAEKALINVYASACALEHGKGVYLANAIAGTLFDYDLESSCSSSPLVEEVENGVEYGHSAAFTVYPSPSDGIVNIRHSFESINSLKVYNSLGKVVQEHDRMEERLDLSNQIPGLYYIEIIDENQGRYVQKVFLQ